MLAEQLSSYITQKGDTWDLISFKVYGSVSYVNQLKRENYKLKKIIIFPEEVALVIPSVISSKKGDDPIWG